MRISPPPPAGGGGAERSEAEGVSFNHDVARSFCCYNLLYVEYFLDSRWSRVLINFISKLRLNRHIARALTYAFIAIILCFVENSYASTARNVLIGLTIGALLLFAFDRFTKKAETSSKVQPGLWGH